MTGLEQQIRFGYFLVPEADQPLVAVAQEAERLGLDYIAVQDHPYQARYVETWSLLAVLAGSTSRIGLLPDVTNLQLRQPAVLAKAAATIDLLSGGRFELGLGAGGFPDAVRAYGGPGRTGANALQALEEAVSIIRKIWSGERNLRLDGEVYRLAGARSGPVPPHAIGVWLGVYGPHALELAARVADGWLPSYRGDRASLETLTAAFDRALDEAGRSRREVRRVLNVPDFASPDEAVELLTWCVLELGFDTFLLGGPPDGLDRIAETIAPAVRANVAAG